MLKKLTAIFRLFVPTNDQVIARQIKNRHKQSTASASNATRTALYKNDISGPRGRYG